MKFRYLTFLFAIIILFSCQPQQTSSENTSNITQTDSPPSTEIPDSLMEKFKQEEEEYIRTIRHNVKSYLPANVADMLPEGEYACINIEAEGPVHLEADLNGDGRNEYILLAHNGKNQSRLMIFHANEKGVYNVMDHTGLISCPLNYDDLDLAHIQVKKEGVIDWFLSWMTHELTLSFKYDKEKNGYYLSYLFSLNRSADYYTMTEVDYAKKTRIQGGEQISSQTGEFVPMEDIISKVENPAMNITAVNDDSIYRDM